MIAPPRPPDGFPLTDAMWAEVVRAHAEPPRHYHTIEHVLEVAARYREVARDAGWFQPGEVFAAVLFHDVIYVAGRRDNEARSAALAAGLLAAHAPDLDTPRVAELIQLTARHGQLAPGDVDDDAALFLDCDMAILGAEPERFAAYERGIAAEYLPVAGEDGYRAGRLAFLERLAARPRIFLSDYFHQRLDAAARTNLAAALASAPTD